MVSSVALFNASAMLVKITTTFKQGNTVLLAYEGIISGTYVTLFVV